MSTKTARSATVSLELREDGILRIEVLPVQGHTTDVARENVEMARRLLEGRRAPALVDLRNAIKLDRPARGVYGNEADFALAQAILIDSPFSRILANLSIRLSGIPQPARVFTSEEDAVGRLAEFLP